MTARDIERLAASFAENPENNRVPDEKALSKDLAGLKMYDAPIFGYASAGDLLFAEFKNTKSAYLPGLMLPEEWLEGAKTVVSIFLPLTEQVRESNRKDMAFPSDLWLNARIEGQEFINDLLGYICKSIESEGFSAVAPSIDKRFKSWKIEVEGDEFGFSSNWSERHAAFAAGLGTFSLNRAIITSRGIAGRLGSVITTLELPITQRKYTGLYEYCTNCGVCARNCPANAITLEKGKSHPPCKLFLDGVREKHPPYYGCGKCQVGVPCERGIPLRKRAI